jgi:hypothetical protein
MFFLLKKMEGRSFSYYDQLLEKSDSILKEKSLVDVSTSFNIMLKNIPEKDAINIGEWFYALTVIHKFKSDSIFEIFPYRPKYILKEFMEDDRTIKNYFISYALSTACPESLKGVLIGFMIDCLSFF